MLRTALKKKGFCIRCKCQNDNNTKAQQHTYSKPLNSIVSKKFIVPFESTFACT